MNDAPVALKPEAPRGGPDLDWLNLVPEVFDKLDKNKDKKLDRSELDLAKCAEFEGNNAKAVAFLKVIQLRYRELKDAGHPDCSEEIGKSLVLTAVALQQIAQKERKSGQQLNKEGYIQALNGFELVNFDTDSNGTLSRKELKKAAEDPKTGKVAKQQLDFLVRHYDSFRRLQDDPSPEVSPLAVIRFSSHIAGEKYKLLEPSTRSIVCPSKQACFFKSKGDQ